MELSFSVALFLFFLAVAAGVVNILAGGGSNLILPLLMVAGLDPQAANATNRVGIWFQSLSGLAGFARKGKLPTHDLPVIVLPPLIGSILGALLAAKLDVLLSLTPLTASLSKNTLIKVILLGTMLAAAAIVLFRPNVVMHPSGCEISARHSPRALSWLFIAGVYGGFVQAGVGFVFITTLAGILRYDLVRANALKIACTILFTTAALIIFIWQGQVHWGIGFIIAAGNALGASVGVRFAVKVSQNTLRWMLFAMTIAAALAAILF